MQLLSFRAKASVYGAATSATMTKGRILLGICAACGAAILVQWNLNARLGREIGELEQRKEEMHIALATNDHLAESRGAELQRLTMLETTNVTDGDDPFSRYSHTKDHQVLVMRVRSLVAEDYSALFRKLRLSPDKQAKFQNLLWEKSIAATEIANFYTHGGIPGVDDWTNTDALKAATLAATEDIDGDMRSVLGQAGYDEYEQYSASIKYRVEANGFASQFNHAAAPLSDSQTDQLNTLLAQADTDPSTPLPDSFQTQASAIFGANQQGDVQKLMDEVQARRAILEMNLAALRNGQLQAQPIGGRFLIQKY